MEIKLDISKDELDWEDNAYIKLFQTNPNIVILEANREGLISFAKQLLALAYFNDESILNYEGEKSTPNGYCYGDLDEGSLALSVVRSDDKRGRKLY